MPCLVYSHDALYDRAQEAVQPVAGTSEVVHGGQHAGLAAPQCRRQGLHLLRASKDGDRRIKLAAANGFGDGSELLERPG